MEDEGGLARTVGAEERHPLAGMNVQVDAIEGAVPIGVGKPDRPHVENGHAHEDHRASARGEGGLTADTRRRARPRSRPTR